MNAVSSLTREKFVRTKSKQRNDKAVNFPQASKERRFHVHMFVEGMPVFFIRNPSLCLSLDFLNFPQIESESFRLNKLAKMGYIFFVYLAYSSLNSIFNSFNVITMCTLFL